MRIGFLSCAVVVTLEACIAQSLFRTLVPFPSQKNYAESAPSFSRGPHSLGAAGNDQQIAIPRINKDSLFLGMNRKALVTYSAIGYSVFTTYMEYKWWWEGNFHPFVFENDGFWNNYSLGVDKIGHAYTSYLYFNAVYDAMKWADVDESTALWWAIGIPAGHAISIEIGDGFSTFAFSADDLLGNLAGVGYAYLQHRVPFFKKFKFKWSYIPSGIIPLDKNFRWTDDYDGHIYWMTADVHNLLPEGLDQYWPKYLNITVGYGAKNSSGRIRPTVITPSGPIMRKWAFGLDYNISALPLTGGAWDLAKSWLDNFHFPAPGIRHVEGEPAQIKPLLLN
ncbi:MAG: DUF2279 domain-containing protein [Ignavibacteriales bacterium]|nr:DUF2279 domain-containing protein [Ignavibacteriales bacterium]